MAGDAPGGDDRLTAQIEVSRMHCELARESLARSAENSRLWAEHWRRRALACWVACGVFLLLILAFFLASMWMGQGELAFRFLDKLLVFLSGLAAGGAGGFLFGFGAGRGKRGS